MNTIYHVKLTKDGQECLEHFNGLVDVILNNTVDNVNIDLCGALRFTFGLRSETELVFAPGMWAGYTATEYVEEN